MKVYVGPVAVAKNGVIGREGKLPWHLPEDLKRFKAITTGHAVVMGRKTWESIGKPLPNRRNIVLTRDPAYPLPPGVERHGSLDEALAACRASGQEKVFVIGGASLFKEAYGRADGAFITWIDREVPGDTFFPFDEKAFAPWKTVGTPRVSGDLRFVELER